MVVQVDLTTRSDLDDHLVRHRLAGHVIEVGRQRPGFAVRPDGQKLPAVGCVTVTFSTAAIRPDGGIGSVPVTRIVSVPPGPTIPPSP